MRARPPVSLALAIALLAAGVPTRADAATAPPAAPVASVAPAGPAQVTPIPLGGDGLARISPELAGVEVDGTAALQAQAAFDLVYTQLQLATATRTGAEAELTSLAEQEVTLTAAIADGTRRRKAAAARLAAARATIRELAVGTYILSADHDSLTRTLDVEHSTEIGSALVLSDSARAAIAAEADAAAAELDEASTAIDDAHTQRDLARARVAEVQASQEQAAADEIRLTGEAGQREFDLQQARATSIVRGTDFTLVALDAFVRAAAGSGNCAMPWWGLAGISRVEGRHGTYGGGRLQGDGQVTNPIIGIPLTGGGGTAFVGDTDGGSLDGDVAYDRAVGPMQFIPSTWARWRADGDGDGDADPQNMYDAVAAAAGYLCYGRVMRSTDDLRAGYFSYNHSQAYVEAVLSYALGYSNFQIPPPPAPGPIPAAYPTAPADPATAEPAAATGAGQ